MQTSTFLSDLGCDILEESRNNSVGFCNIASNFSHSNTFEMVFFSYRLAYVIQTPFIFPLLDFIETCQLKSQLSYFGNMRGRLQVQMQQCRLAMVHTSLEVGRNLACGRFGLSEEYVLIMAVMITC